MKVVTPEISWHEREPIYSVDLQPTSDNFQRLASCGVDKIVRIWRVRVDGEGKVDVDFLSNLRRHTATVNVCRFSPDGKLLATAGDDAVILLWKLNDVPTPANNIFSDEDADNKESWVVYKSLRGHLGDVYDLCWSPDSRNIVSGSVDNSAIAWDTQKDTKLALFNEHKSYVQGVAWDPMREYIATLSSDRSCRIFNLSTKHCIHNISKIVPRHIAASTPEGTKPKATRMFHDDTLRSFFRRLAFSPDGQLLIAPAGTMETGEGQTNATFVFTRGSFKEPASYLPSPNKASVAVRVCPLLFELRLVRKENSAEPMDEDAKEWEKYSTVFCLPYRVVFAVATEDSVVLYDSQQTLPFAYLSNIHYHTLSDLSWSRNGQILVVSSTDGYCSVVTFEEGELGVPYTPKPALSVSIGTQSPLTPKSPNTLVQNNTMESESSPNPKHSTAADEEKMDIEVTGSTPSSSNLNHSSTLPNKPATSDSSLITEISNVRITQMKSVTEGVKIGVEGVEKILESIQPGVKQPKRIQLTTLSLLKPK
ncbi:chromatin assembly factor 1 subunit B-like [Littorina saxatilis]|uniref:Chromatin assembly factor 1 subunit B n=1 Tax=Littorina saxatilis TaxID=31220 RepID=A0AAN9GH02_9CAEN